MSIPEDNKKLCDAHTIQQHGCSYNGMCTKLSASVNQTAKNKATIVELSNKEINLEKSSSFSSYMSFQKYQHVANRKW